MTSRQVQRYEHGTARVDAGLLCRLLLVLQVPVSFFFDDIDPFQILPTAKGKNGEKNAAPGRAKETPMMPRETLDLVRAYSRISDSPTRSKITEFVVGVAERSGPAVR